MTIGFSIGCTSKAIVSWGHRCVRHGSQGHRGMYRMQVCSRELRPESSPPKMKILTVTTSLRLPFGFSSTSSTYHHHLHVAAQYFHCCQPRRGTPLFSYVSRCLIGICKKHIHMFDKRPPPLMLKLGSPDTSTSKMHPPEIF